MNMTQKVKAGYNIAAKNYSSDFRDQFKSEKYLAKLVTFLKPKSSILDIGCGAGKPIDSYLISEDMQVSGIDISEAQIQLAKSYVPQACYEVRDMSELKVGDYQENAIVSFYAIFHTPRENHLDLLKKFKSFLKPNGYLLITMGANNWEGESDNFCGSHMYWSHFGAKKNRELLIKAGFKIIFSEIDNSGGENHLIILAKN